MKYEVMLEQYMDKLIQFGVRVVIALLVFGVGLKVIGLFRRLITRFMEKSKADKGVIQFTDAFVKFSLIIILVLSIATHFGLNVTSVATVLASAGVTIGLAVQGSLSNFVGGILILLLKPFKVGDYIIEDTNKNEGTVHEISMFYTKLITMDESVVVLPNGTLANTSITNVTTKKHRRMDFKVAVSYQTDIKKAKEILTAILEEDARIVKNKEHFVYVSELADSSILLGVRCYVKQLDFWRTKWDLLEKIKIVLDENGIEIPYNQIDVHIKSEK